MESISRISGLIETTRELTLEAARDAGARKISTKPISNAQLKALLDSRHDREVLDGLRRVISQSLHNPTDQEPLLFSAVLKNIASPSLAVKKLVYIYLLEHAEHEPDTALLAINTIQKTLSAPDPHLRALSLRVMSGIRVPVISQIVSLAIKKGSADMSPLVRKAAALAIPKCWRLDPSTSSQLQEYLSILMADRQYFVIGAAVIAFMEVCPERLDLIHKHYRDLVRKLVDMDEWGQLATLRLMNTYALENFPLRIKHVKKSTSSNDHQAFYDDEIPHEVDPSSNEPTQEIELVDPDLILLLKSAQSLLQSRNSAVITAVTRLYLSFTPPPTLNSPLSTYLPLCIPSLIALLRCPPSIRLIALHNIVHVSLAHAPLFLPYTTHFLLRSSNVSAINILHLEILTLIFPHAPPHLQALILTEASTFTRAGPPALIRASVRALGACATSSPPGSPVARRCMALLLSLLDGTDEVLVAEALTVVRLLVQSEPEAHAGTVARLAARLDRMRSASARASVVWLVGEFAGRDGVAADVLRLLARGFADEEEVVRAQIVLLAAKVYVHYLNDLSATKDDDASALPAHDHPIPLLYSYIQHLTRYDTSYDIRDRARGYTALLSNTSPTTGAPNTQLATLLLLAPKPAPSAPSPSAASQGLVLGSASLVLGEQTGGLCLKGYEALALPSRVLAGQEPDAKLRDELGGPDVVMMQQSASERLARDAVAADPYDNVKKVTNGTVAEKTLDDWLAESERESEEDDESSESESSEETDESEDEDE